MIFLITFILILLILFIPIRCTLHSNANGMGIKLRIIFISRTIYPTKDKKAEKTQKNISADEKNQTGDAKKTFRILFAAKGVIISSVKKIVTYIAKHAIVIENIDINAKIGTGDPADTGIICGGIYSFVYSSIGVISSATNLKKHSVQIDPDFYNPVLSASINVTLKTSLIHIFIIAAMAASLLIKYLRIKKSYERSLNTKP